MMIDWWILPDGSLLFLLTPPTLLLVGFFILSDSSGDCLYSDGTYKQGSVLYITWELICASVSAIHCNLSNNYKTSKHTKYVLLHYYVPPTYDLHCSLLLLLLLSWIIFYSLCTLWICHIIHSLFYAFRN